MAKYVFMALVPDRRMPMLYDFLEPLYNTTSKHVIVNLTSKPRFASAKLGEFIVVIAELVDNDNSPGTVPSQLILE